MKYKKITEFVFKVHCDNNNVLDIISEDLMGMEQMYNKKFMSDIRVYLERREVK